MTLMELSFGEADSAPAATETNADRAYDIVRERLVMLDIRPGEPINDDRLAAELGFGRTPLREALKRLERDRLVVAYPRRGTFAAAVDMTDLADISEIRKLLEPTAAARAARVATPDTRARLTALAQAIAGIDDSDDPREVLRHDVPLEQKAGQLVDVANANGGRDNISVLLAQVQSGSKKRGLISRLLGK